MPIKTSLTEETVMALAGIHSPSATTDHSAELVIDVFDNWNPSANPSVTASCVLSRQAGPRPLRSAAPAGGEPTHRHPVSSA
ncbi:hypothetical protein [Streptomonospora litoralis]|uniref:Uncharacterized protein n=1 Tax=Streptomonospora litoralis TaxID=2498135 RepID=A0A4P6Q8W6_9ACTN|nr:hypothetical protein [Streptomonospora litoralis]QBI55457.1 hypothetical protein EKD16_18465 [Streptomonospora litoralis]